MEPFPPPDPEPETPTAVPGETTAAPAVAPAIAHPAGIAQERPRKIRLGWHPLWRVLFAVFVLLGLSAAAASVVRAPYVVIAPGSATATEPAISAPGTETFETDGSVYFLTISLRGATRRMGYTEALYGWLRPDHDVFPRDAILGGQSGQENRDESVQEMAVSQEVAAKVALEQLGYDVPSLGTGTVVSGTIEGSPAAEVLEPGDVITSLGDTKTPTDVHLREAVAPYEPGDVVEVTFERGPDDEEHEAEIELIGDPDDPDRTLLGVVQVFTRDLEFDLPFPVRVDAGDVGGPSAGLALTLGMLDVLTPGSLTGGHDIAVTGTINLDGSVGQVGGVGQKAIVASEQGVELLLVPAAELDLAEEFADDDLTVVGVDTLEDALRAIAELGGNADDLIGSG